MLSLSNLFCKTEKRSLPVHVLLLGLPVVHRLQLAKENLSHRFLRKKMNMIVRYQWHSQSKLVHQRSYLAGQALWQIKTSRTSKTVVYSSTTFLWLSERGESIGIGNFAKEGL